MMEKKLSALLLLAVILIPIAYALGIYVKELAGLGIVRITDEVTIEEIEIDDASTVKIKMAPNTRTIADKTYTVKLYLDGELGGQQTISWTQSEKDAGTKKKLTFTGLNLAEVSVLKFEVTA